MENRTKINLQEICLGIIGAAGTISLTLLAPNALRILKDWNLLDNNRRQKCSLNRSLKNLIFKGYVIRYQNGLHLSPKGKRKLESFTLRHAMIENKAWDGKWRIVGFDIPEKKKKLRVELRSILKTVNFIRIQDSVWLFPYDCEEYVELLKHHLKIEKHLLFFKTETLTGDLKYRKYFGL